MLEHVQLHQIYPCRLRDGRPAIVFKTTDNEDREFPYSFVALDDVVDVTDTVDVDGRCYYSGETPTDIVAVADIPIAIDLSTFPPAPTPKLTIKPNSRYRLRDGRLAQMIHIASDEAQLTRPIVGIVEGDVTYYTWMPDGNYYLNGEDSPSDIVEEIKNV